MTAIQTQTDPVTPCVVLFVIEPTPGDKQIFADPQEFTVSRGDNVCWDARVGEEDKVTIKFEKAECGDQPANGPFATPLDLERTGPALMHSPPTNCYGRWKYSVTWRRPGWKAHTLDPYIIVKG